MINVGKWHGRIFHKNSGSFNNFKNVSKSAFFRGFWTFSRNLVIHLVLFVAENGSTNRIWGFCENRMSGKTPVLEIFIPKGQFRSKMGVQRSSYISRTVNAMKNLIWYSKSTKNYLSDYCHQIFPYSSSSGSKFDLKTANFQFFVHFLNFLRPFCRQLL